MLALLSLPPTLFSRFKGLRWKEEYGPLLPALSYLVVFLIAHSIVPHKEERFLIPILGVFLILLVPLVVQLLHERSWWRIGYGAAVNGVLLVLCVTAVPQNSVIGLATFVENNKTIVRLVAVDDTLVFFPASLIERKLKYDGISGAQLGQSPALSCDGALVIRQSIREHLPEVEKNYHKVAEFRPGLLEGIAIRINPNKNARRGTIELYLKRGCGL